jgi:excisionase family DNA binding protein
MSALVAGQAMSRAETHLAPVIRLADRRMPEHFFNVFNNSDYITVKEAANRLGVSKRWVSRRMIEADPIPHVKLGQHKQSPVRLHWPSVLAWFGRHYPQRGIRQTPKTADLPAENEGASSEAPRKILPMLRDPEAFWRTVSDVGALLAEHEDDGLARALVSVGLDPEVATNEAAHHLIRDIAPAQEAERFLLDEEEAAEAWRESSLFVLLYGIALGRGLGAREAEHAA